MHALAMLEPDFANRVRPAVEPPGILTSRADTSSFIDAVKRGWADVAIVDPTLAQSSAAVPTVLCEAHLGTVLYIRLTQEYAVSLVAFVRRVEAVVVIFGHNDDPRAFASLLLRSSRTARGKLLLTLLGPCLEELPKSIRDGINDLNERCRRADSVATLACYCGVPRSTLTRRLRMVGIRSAIDLIAALNLVRNFDVLADSRLSLQSSARTLGLASARRLTRRCVGLAGMTPCEIRENPSLESFTTRIVDSLTSPKRV